MGKKKIVFAMIEAGGGHKAAANALRDALELRHPGLYDTVVLDFMKDLGCVDFDRAHKDSWDYFLAHPVLCTLAFDLQEAAFPLSRSFLRRYPRPFMPHLLEWLGRAAPDLIVSTHFLNCYPLADARRRTGASFKHLSIVTELFGAQSFYSIEGSDAILLPSERARRQLMRRGIRGDRLVVEGYPLSPGFLELKRSRAEIRAAMGLREGKRCLLVSFGSQGLGNVDGFLGAIRDSGRDMDVVFVAGRNAALKDRLEAETGGRLGASTLKVIGFATNMNELMAASDVCLVKPGPATAMEVFYSHKPVLFTVPVAHHERWNVKYAMEKGLGRYVGNDPRKLLAALAELEAPGAEGRIAAAYEGFDVAVGTWNMAEYIHAAAQGAPLPGPQGRWARKRA